jgi:flagellar hook-basal body complex protein FliE
MNTLSAIPSFHAAMLPRVLPGSDVAETPGALAPSAPAGGGDFSSLVKNLVADVNAQQANAGQMVGAMQSGQNVPLHQAVLAMEEASVSFQLLVEVRNKLLESYQEIMRMQI